MNKISAGDRLPSGIFNPYAGFKRVDNFVNTSGDMLAISNDPSLLAANTIITDAFSPGKIIHVEISDKAIILNNKKYLPDQIKIFHSDFTYPNKNLAEIQHTIRTFINQNSMLFPAGSLLFLLMPGVNSSPGSTFDRLLRKEFEQAFAQFYDHFFESIRSFRSKGRGLTPSGDDFIAGVLYGIHCLETISGQNHRNIIKQVYETAAGENLFSKTMLTMAREARYFKRLQDFLDTLFHKKNAESNAAFLQLTGVGETSGADLISGFFAVLLEKPRIFEIS